MQDAISELYTIDWYSITEHLYIYDLDMTKLEVSVKV